MPEAACDNDIPGEDGGPTASLWPRLLGNFDPDEETANFGTRLALEARGGALFDVVTLAIFEPEGPARHFPNLCSLSTPCSSSTAVALNSCLHVVHETSGDDDDDDDDASEETVSAVLAGQVDCLAWSACRRFVLAGLATGQLQVLHLPTKRPLPALHVGEETLKQGKFFVHCYIQEEGLISIRMTGTNAKVYIISGLDLDGLDRSLRSGDLASLKGLQSQISISLLHNDPFTREAVLCATTVVDANGNESTVVGVEGGLGLLSDDGASLAPFLPLDYLPQGDVSPARLAATRVLKNTLVCLDDSGTVHVICLRTMATVFLWSKEEVLNLVLIEDAGDCQKLNILLTVAKPDGESVLQMREFPSFCLLYELEVNSFCHPVDCGINHETPRFIEGTEELSGDAGLALRMRGISESVLEARLQRLLRRQRFEEAEALAESFKLSMQDLHKAKITWLADRLSPWKDPRPDEEETAELTKEFRSTLGKITDLNYVVQCCVTTALPEMQQIRSLLLLARETIRNNSDAGEKMSLDLMVTVSRTLQRLETFSLVGAGRDGEDGRGSVVDRWAKFSRSDPLEECRLFVRAGDLRCAALMWNRHRAEWEVNEEVAREMLEIMPTKWGVETRLDWLSKFLPDCLRSAPDCLPAVALWADRATRDYESSSRSSRGDWPGNGLRFARGVLSALSFNCRGEDLLSLRASRAQLVLNQQRSDPASQLSKLTSLIESLEDLHVLHVRFKLRLKLADFLKEDKREVATFILDWCVEKEEFSRVVEGFLENYLSRHGLDSSDVLAEYMMELIEQSETSWHWSLQEAPWESRVQVLLPYVRSSNRKADCVLAAVKAAPVPWSPIVKALSAEGTKLTGVQEKATLIREQETTVGLKQILKKYNCKSLNLSGRELERLYQFMIATKSEEGFEDALEVAKTFPDGKVLDVKTFLVKHLLFGKGDTGGGSIRAAQVLEGLQHCPGEQMILGERILTHCEVLLKLREEPLGEASLAFLSAFRRILEGGDQARDELLERISQVKKKVQLRVEFGVSEAALRELPASQILKRCMDERTSSCTNLNALRASCSRLCLLLDLSAEAGVDALATSLSEAGRHGEAVEAAGTTEVDGRREVAGLADAIASASSSLAVGGASEQTARALRTACSRLAATCPPHLIARYAVLARWQDLLQRALDRCGSSLPRGGARPLTPDASDAFTHWKLGPLFSDKGLPPDRKVLVQLAEGLGDLWRGENEDGRVEGVLAGAIKQLKSYSHVELSLAFKDAVRDSLEIMCPTGTEGRDQQFPEAFSLQEEEVVSLLRKSLGERRPDLHPATAHLMRLNNKQFLTAMVAARRALGFDYSKLVSLCCLAARACAARGMGPRPAGEFASLSAAASWGLRCRKEFGVDFEHACTGGLPEREAALLELMERSPRFSVGDLRRYCRCFGLEVAPAAAEYVRTTLSKAEPTVSAVAATAAGERQQEVAAVLKPDDFDESLSACDEALELLGDEVVAERLVAELFETVSPYNYEVLEFVIVRLRSFDCHSARAVKAAHALDFLKRYQRVSEPSQKEVETWTESRTAPFPRIARVRLPLTWLVTGLTPRDRFKVLRREFKLSNYRLWCDVSGVMNIHPDNICVFAVNNAVEDEVQRADDVDGQQDWKLAYIYKDLTTKVVMCVNAISDRQKAASCAHFYISRLPGGADKVLAAEGFACLAQEWLHEVGFGDADNFAEVEESHAAAAQALGLMEDNLLRLRVEDALRQAGLWTDEYSGLMHQKTPEDLVCKLFEDPSIVRRGQDVGGRFPDVSGAAEKIAAAAALDLRKVKLRLLDRWLPEKRIGTAVDLDVTVSNLRLRVGAAGGGASGEKVEDEDTINFLRCVYLAQSCDSDVLNYLLAFGFSKEVSVGTGCKLRALRVLLSVSDDAGVLEATSMSVDEVTERLRALHFSARLERLNLPSDSCADMEGDAGSLAQTVLRTCGHGLEGLELAAELCLHHGVRSPPLWTSILEQMVRLDLGKELDAILMELNTHPQLWHFPAFVNAWRHVLLRPFARAGGVPISGEDRKRCWRSLELLRCCPLASGDLDLGLLRGECRRLGLLDLEEELSRSFG